MLDDLLADWSAHARTTFEGVRVLGSRWSPQSYAARDFLSRNQIPYHWIDVEQDASMRDLALSATGGDLSRLPVVVLSDGTMLTQPTQAELAARIGLQTVAERPFYDLAIVGGGPAGLACAVYGASEGLKVVLIEQNAPGGQAGTSSMIENYLGFPNGVTGADLARRAATQAKRFGAECRRAGGDRAERATPSKSSSPTAGSRLHGSCCPGDGRRELEVPGSAAHRRGRVLRAALSEAAICGSGCWYRAARTGGAGRALLRALRRARHDHRAKTEAVARHVQHWWTDQRRWQHHRIGNWEVAAMHGSSQLERVDDRNAETGETQALDGHALFIFIGVAPRTNAFAPVVATDDQGFILTGADAKKAGWGLERDPLMFETSVPGIFAAGDVRATANRRIAAAVGEGSAAIFSVHQYLRGV